MKIAVPTTNGQIEAHFGHCAEFRVYTIGDDKNIIEEDTVIPPPECGCKSEIIPQLAEAGVSVMLAGNMGGGAVQMLGHHGIEVFRGLAGDVRNALEAWLAGSVTDSGSECGGSEGHGCNH